MVVIMNKEKQNKTIYELLADFGKIGTKQVRGKTYDIRLQRVAWYGHKVWDLRCVDEEGNTSKGFTMHTEQLKALRDTLDLIDFDAVKE